MVERIRTPQFSDLAHSLGSDPRKRRCSKRFAFKLHRINAKSPPVGRDNFGDYEIIKPATGIVKPSLLPFLNSTQPVAHNLAPVPVPDVAPVRRVVLAVAADNAVLHRVGYLLSVRRADPDAADTTSDDGLR